LRPPSDALNERLGGRRVKQLITEGAIEIARRLDPTADIAVVRFAEADIVRHSLVPKC
jgi:phosphate starvation-inducible protein PhoH